MNVKQAWGLFKGAASAWLDDYAPSMGAALAYYTMVSIAPLLLIVISIAGRVLGEEAARGEILRRAGSFARPQQQGMIRLRGIPLRRCMP